ncbi:MAG: phosphatase PAP2 family protein [Roseovarius sp.]|nr:phosphatase PAP2 family protein [Roseovarius sp.]
MTIGLNSHRLYYVVLTILLLDGAILVLSQARLDTSYLIPWLVFASALLFGFIFIRRKLRQQSRPHPALFQLAQLLEGLFFLKLAWLALRLLNHLTMMTAIPLADDMLAGWDHALGISWHMYFDWVHASPVAIEILKTSYTSLTSLSVLALAGLIAMRQTLRARYFIEVFFVTALICIVMGAGFPAKAAVLHIIPDLSLYPNFDEVPGSYHIEHLTALRGAEGSVTLELSNLPGLVTFPSFHTAAGILLSVAYWRTRLFAPVVGYTVIMIASTPVFGAHYFIDIFAGAAIAGIVCTTCAARTKYRGLFTNASTEPLNATLNPA